jgi:hypothetical protein
MDINRAIKIIDLEPTEFCALKEEKMEAFKVFFKSFAVDIIDKNGNYKTVYEILKEAAMNKGGGK